MRTIRLYTPEQLQSGASINLDNTASHHLIRVLRQKQGATVIVFNGNGKEYTARLLDQNPKNTSLLIEQEQTAQTGSQLDITLLQGISRGDRMDTTVQKATELGVSEIIAVVCERTNLRLDKSRGHKKQQHWQQIAISASEQSGRCTVPVVNQRLAFPDALQQFISGTKLVLHPGASMGLKQLPQNPGKIILLSGPEGGLTDHELDTAIEQGFTAVHMGPRILRTETAAPACIAALQVMVGDSG